MVALMIVEVSKPIWDRSKKGVGEIARQGAGMERWHAAEQSPYRGATFRPHLLLYGLQLRNAF